MKNSFFFSFVFLLSVTPAYADDFNFSSYIPILDSLYSESKSPIESGYDFKFKGTVAGSEDFVYYIRKADNTLTPVYYIIETPTQKNGIDTSILFNDNSQRITADLKDADVSGYFWGLNVSGYSWNQGGAIYNYNGDIGDIAGDFIRNYVSTSSGNSQGGAVNNAGNIDSITGDFIGNHVSAFYQAQGGAIYSNNHNTIGDIRGDFIGNYVSGSSSGSLGGAIYNGNSTIGNISGSFIGNHAQSSSGQALGGAVYMADSNLTFIADGADNIFTGNYTKDPARGKIYNAIFVGGTKINDLRFNTANSGTITFDDNIETARSNSSGIIVDYSLSHNIYLSGDGSGKVVFNNDLINVGDISVSNSTMVFGKGPYGYGRFLPKLNADGTADMTSPAVTELYLRDSTFDINNGYMEKVSLKEYTGYGSYLKIDVNPDLMLSDVLSVNGDVRGGTKLVVHAGSGRDIRGKGSILFAESFNDTSGSAYSFSIFRVYGSPYLYDIIYDDLGSNSHTWSFAMNEDDNPDYVVNNSGGGKQNVASEVVDYIGLVGASLEQTRNLAWNVQNKVSNDKISARRTVYEENWAGEPQYDAWVSPVYFSSLLKEPVHRKADIHGLEAGMDVQKDFYNKLGIFVSYRKGNYDFDGRGEKYYSTVGSEIDITTYLGGLYYRYDYDKWWMFAMAYGGLQQTDIRSKDGVNADADGFLFGGRIEMGKVLPINPKIAKDWTLEPSLGLNYTQAVLDDISDDYGKTVKYGNLRQMELEAAVKLEKSFHGLEYGSAKAYVKAGLIRQVVQGDEVEITGMNAVESCDDAILAKFETGTKYNFSNSWAAHASFQHITGNDYSANAFNATVLYTW